MITATKKKHLDAECTLPPTLRKLPPGQKLTPAHVELIKILARQSVREYLAEEEQS